jgi:hypothetical protein
MRQLNKWQTAVYLSGAVLMVVGAGSQLLLWAAAPYVFALGALGFASMQMLQSYDGSNFVIRRLRRIMLLSDVLFLVSAVLMFASQGNAFHIDHLTYLQYVYNKWVVTLLIAAILQLYTSHRIGNELAKEAKKL